MFLESSALKLNRNVAFSDKLHVRLYRFHRRTHTQPKTYNVETVARVVYAQMDFCRPGNCRIYTIAYKAGQLFRLPRETMVQNGADSSTNNVTAPGQSSAMDEGIKSSLLRTKIIVTANTAPGRCYPGTH